MDYRPIPEPVAWWDASTITGVADLQPVSAWSDSSPNGYNATANGSTYPALYASHINGNNSVRFSGSNSFSSLLTSSVNVFTAFMVAAPATMSGNRNILGASTNGGMEFRYNNTSRQLVVRAVLASASTSAEYAITQNQYEILNSSWNASSQSIHVNGNLAIQSNYSPNITAGRTTLIGGGTSGMNGYIAEILIYHRVLSNEERATVNSYLSDKYGITVADYIPYTPAGGINVYDGSTFVQKPMKVWSGSTWQEKTPSVWNGAEWV